MAAAGLAAGEVAAAGDAPGARLPLTVAVMLAPGGGGTPGAPGAPGAIPVPGAAVIPAAPGAAGTPGAPGAPVAG